MLLSEVDPAAKRARLREGLAGSRILRVAGAYSPLVAMAVEAAGFDGVYVGSSTLSTELGMPDVGLVTQTEAAIALPMTRIPGAPLRRAGKPP